MILSKVWSTFHQLKNRGFFRYLGRNLLLIVLIYALLITAALLMGRYLVDFELLFLLFAMTRLVRFVIQGAIFFDILRLDTLVS